MLRSMKEITGYKLLAFDGEIGKCKDFLMDAENWVVRYMVADTGNWLSEHKVLISPISLESPSSSNKTFPVALNKSDIENAPGLDKDAPVSRQWEKAYNEYFGLPFYWSGSLIWGISRTPASLREEVIQAGYEEVNGHTDLRSFNEIHNYTVVMKGKDSATVHDFILNDEDWSISQIVVDAGNLFFGKKILVPQSHIYSVDFFNKEITLNEHSLDLEDYPEYDSHRPVNIKLEAVPYDYKGRPVLVK